MLVDLAIVVGANEIKRAVVAERAPFGIDQDMLLFAGRPIVALGVLDLFNIACVAAGAWFWCGSVIWICLVYVRVDKR